MKKLKAAIDKKWETQRFSVSVPLTITAGDKEFLGYTRDLSNRGMYFYVSPNHGTQIDDEFDCIVELPPEITLSTRCRIQCRARLLRREIDPKSMFGIAAEILKYSILRDSPVSA